MRLLGMTFDEGFERELDLEIPQHRARRAAKRNKDRMDELVREVGERDRSRRPGHDPEVRVRFVDPGSL